MNRDRDDPLRYEREKERKRVNNFGPHWRARIYDAANTLYTLFCLHAKYRLTVTLSNEIKGGHPSLSLSLPLSLFFFFFLSSVRKRGATHRGTSTWPTTPLHSLTRHGRATGAFLFTRATSCSNFVFLSCPSPPSASFFLSCFLSFFLSFPFLLLLDQTPTTGIMQRITEKSKQANDHEIHVYHPPARYARDSLFLLFLSSFFFPFSLR